jgi:hypothetical protein
MRSTLEFIKGWFFEIQTCPKIGDRITSAQNTEEARISVV